MRGKRMRLELEDGTLCRYIGSREASDFLRTGAAQQITRKKGAVPAIRMRPDPSPSKANPSALSITVKDMYANAGIAEPYLVKKARAKVRQFSPSLHGTALHATGPAR